MHVNSPEVSVRCAVRLCGLDSFSAEIDSWLVLVRPAQSRGIIVAHIYAPGSIEASVFNAVNSSNKRGRHDDSTESMEESMGSIKSMEPQDHHQDPSPPAMPCLMRALLLVGMQRSLDMFATRSTPPKLPEAIAATIDAAVDPASSLNARVHAWFWDQGVRTVEYVPWRRMLVRV
jgi:hypothetical protein